MFLHSRSSHVSAIQRLPCLHLLQDRVNSCAVKITKVLSRLNEEFHHTTWDAHHFKGGKNFRAKNLMPAVEMLALPPVYMKPMNNKLLHGGPFSGFRMVSAVGFGVLYPEIQHRIATPKPYLKGD